MIIDVVRFKSTFRLSSVQPLSQVQLFATPWTAACQASLSITSSWSLLKLMSVESVMPSNHLEKEMAAHSSIPAWRIPQAEEPGGLQSIGSQSRTPLKPLSTVVSYSFVITIKILLISARQWSFKLKKLLNW